jgi:centrosomal protein CEP104
MPKKILFQVIYSSSADEQHQANELNHQGPFVNGWQSNRLCSYPQEVILQFENYIRLKRLQLLSHQFLIGNIIFFNHFWLFIKLFLASKIEFLIGDCSPDQNATQENAHYTRLG